MHGGSLYDLNTLHFCLIHDGNKYTSKAEDDVVRLGWDHGGGSKYGVYAINFDAKMTQYLNDHPDAELSNQAAIYKQGKALGMMIKEVLNSTGADKVILIGHSMGGLAIREYLQRKDESGRQLWWVDPNDEVAGHHVAKIGTIATPHGGSNVPYNFATDKIAAWWQGKDLKSEAIRDLDPKSVYLNDGYEYGDSRYYNNDINCDGVYDADKITGLNNFYFPKNLAYSCIIGIGDILGADLNPLHIGDGIVSKYRANLDNFTDADVDTFVMAKPEVFDETWHPGMLKKFGGIIRILDEPQSSSLAYEIGTNSSTTGFITFGTYMNPVDIDLYKINIEKDGTLKIKVTASSFTGLKAVSLIDQDGSIKPITDISQPFEYEATAGTYYLQIRGIAVEDGPDAPGSYKYPYTIQTQFTATPTPALAVSVSNLNFYDAVIGSPKQKTVKLTNNGIAPLLITGLGSTSSDASQFTVSPMPPYALQPGADNAQTLTVSFNPTAVGAKTGSLEITTNSPDIPVKTVLLQGNGVATATRVLALNCATSYNFGNTKINTSRSKAFSIKNTGSDPCAINQLAVEGLNPDQYTITSPSVVPFDIGWGETKYVTVSFTPTSIGSKNAQLAIYNNSDNISPIHSVDLYGNGTENYYSGNNNTLLACEYWFDDAYDSKTKQAVPQDVESEMNVNLATTDLITGLHSLHIRYKDRKGKWSSVTSEFFYKMPLLNGTTQTLTTCEYWYDDDYANKVLSHDMAGQQVSILSGNLNATSLAQGLHAFHIRYKDSSNRWSSVASEFFYKMPINTSVPNLITSYRYWFDSETTKMTNVKLLTTINPCLLVKDFDCSKLSKGNHSVHFQFKDSAGQWSSVYSATVLRDNVAPTANAGIDQTAAQGTLVRLNGTASTDADNDDLTYQWSAPLGIVLSSTTTATPTFTAPAVSRDTPYTFSLVVSDGTLTSTADEVTVAVKNSTAIQTINLSAGWNIISANVVQTNLEMKSIFQGLIDAGKLKKVMDESGKTLENFGMFGGWKNNIGNWQPTEGYKVNVPAATVLTLEGQPIPLPFEIPLSTGWNIISYPATSFQNVKAAFQSLIDTGKLKKVMDESGKTLENFGAYGGWKNSIGSLTEGKGYKVNVTGSCTLTISEGGTKAATIVPEVLASTHFTPIYSGNGTDHMNVNLVDLSVSGIELGDELGVFDGSLCVGSAKIGVDQLTGDYLSIPVSASDGLTSVPNGFTEGHLLTVRYYREGKEYTPSLELLNDSKQLFAKGESIFLRMKSEQTTGIDPLTQSEKISVKCYPNPFSEQVTIEIELPKPGDLKVEVFDTSGRLIRTLYKGNANKNEHLLWDGRGQSGVRMPSGTYLLKVNDLFVKVILSK